MDSLDARITARTAGMDRLSRLTTWIGVGAIAAVGVFAVIAAATIPGKASSQQGAPSSANASTSTTTSLTHRHHEEEFGSSTISTSSGLPVVVTGGSR